MKKIILLACLAFIGYLPAAQMDVINYNVQQGLVQSQVFDIVQDNDGFIWFATAGGISRFDGHDFISFTKRQGIADNFTTSALLDRDGFLWFGHQKGKLSKINPKTFEIQTYQIKIDNKPQNKLQIISLFEDVTGRLWILTVGKGLFFLQDGKFYPLSRKMGLLSSYVYKMIQYNDSTLWVATARGLSTINCRDSIPQKCDSLGVFGLKNPYIVDLVKDRDGRVWFSILDEGLFYLNPDGSFNKITKKDGLIENNIWGIALDPKGGMWLTYNVKGISYLEVQELNQNQYRISHFNSQEKLTTIDIFKIFVDREGNVWLGLNGKGVDLLRKSLLQTYRISGKNMPENIVWSIWGDGKRYWFGLENGLASMDMRTGKIDLVKKIDGVELNSVMQILAEKNGDFWIISYGSGIFHYDSQQRRFRRFKIPEDIDPRFVYCISKDDEDKYWFGFEFFGLLIYDSKSKTFKRLTRSDNKILSDSIAVLYNDGVGNMWIGTFDAGLIQYDGSTFKLFSSETGFPIHGVNSITRGPDGRLWLISDSDEVVVFDGEKVEVLTERFGLRQNSLYSLSFWKNQLWVGTNRGIVCIDLKSGGKYDIGLNTGFDVTEANERAVFIAPDSSLWFGTIDGVIRVNPASLQDYMLSPNVELYDVKIFSQHAEWPEDSRLSHNKNHLTFVYTGIFFKVPEWLKFQYRLRGFDREWSKPTDSRSVTYSYIPPGEYMFEVRASIDGVNWSEPATLSFTISPPFYKTWWFLFMASLFIFSVVMGTIYYRDKKNKQIQAYLEQKVNERTQELLQQKERVETINKALSESESKFRTLTEISPSAIFIYQDYKFIYVNPATEKITGYKKEELLDKPIFEIVHPDFKAIVAERARKRLKGEKVPDRYEFKIIRKDGQERWVDFSARAITYLGKEAGLGTVFDVTERKRAEEALLEEKERLDATLSAIGDGVIATDREQRIIICNKRALNILGPDNFEEKKYIGAYFPDLFKIFNENTNEPLPNPVSTLIESNGANQIEGSGFLKSRGKKKVLIEYSAAPIFDKHSNIIGVVIAFRDVTAKRRMEAELLKNQKLESIGVLAGGIAHDFNNFLTAIMGNLSLLRMRMNEEDKRLISRIQSAEKAAEKAQELTQQLLTFSKGGLPIKKTTDIRELVQDSAEFVLSGANVDFVLESDSDLWHAEVDQGQINQVIQNLIINANQAMPNGGTIYLKLKNMELKTPGKLPLEAGKYIKITIKDQGVGIPPKYLSKIFDPFFSTKQSGSGLGLTTAFSIVKKHKGHIEVQSEVGVGTEFTIYLPATTKRKEKVAEKLKFSKFKFGNQRPVVLIMDDEEMVRDLAANLFDQLGFVVIQARDGSEAINLYKSFKENERKIDLVVMDLTIPGGMGGKEAIKKLLEVDPDARVVVSSGYSNDPVMAQFEKYGFKACLRKPFKLEELLVILNGMDFNGN
ncbi:PAS domain S-box protein [Caldithrix abyssi]